MARHLRRYLARALACEVAVFAAAPTAVLGGTFRLPINTYTVGTTWWNAYTGVQSGLCLDVNASTSKVQLWACWGGENQKWQVQSA